MSKPAIQSIILDVLRGIAALAVLISHGDHNQLIPISILSFNEVKGFLGKFGVGLFFVMSGYLIWSSAKKVLPQPSGLKTYAVHRITRIMPLYYVNVLAAAFLIPAIGYTFQPDISAYTIFRHLIFIQDFIPQVDRALNPVLWSLSHEMLFYALVPPLFLLMQNVRYRFLAGIGLITMIPIVQVYSGPFFPFVHNFFLFVIGILAAEKIKGPLPSWVALVVTVIFAFAVKLGALDTAISASLGLAITVFVYAFCIRSPGKIGKILMKPLAFVGVISYSLYIWHYLLIQIIPAHWNVIIPLLERLHLQILWHNEVLRGLTVIAVNLAFAALSYWLIEKPGMGPLRKWLLKANQNKLTTASPVN